MTARIRKLTLNLNIPPLRDDQHVRDVQSLLHLLPKLVTDSFQQLEKAAGAANQQALTPSLVQEISLPDMDVDQLISNPVLFAQTIAKSIFNSVYQESLPVHSVRNQTDLKHHLGFWQTDDNLFSKQHQMAISEFGVSSDLLLAYLYSGYASTKVLSGTQANIMVNQFLEALIIRRPSASKTQPVKSPLNEDHLSATLTPSGSLTYDLTDNKDFKNRLFTVLENALVKQRLIRLFSNAADKDKVILALWRMVTLDPITQHQQEVIRQTLKHSQGVKRALHYIILLSKKNISQKSKRFIALIRLEFIPTITNKQRRQCESLFLNTQSEQCIRAAQTWLAVAYVQVPGLKEQQALDKLIQDNAEYSQLNRSEQTMKTVSQSTTALTKATIESGFDSIEATADITARQKQSVLAELAFWKQARSAILSLLDVSQQPIVWANTLCSVEKQLENTDYQFSRALLAIKHQLTLLRLYWQDSVWPLANSDQYYLSITLDKILALFAPLNKQGSEQPYDSTGLSRPVDHDYSGWLAQALKQHQQQWQRHCTNNTLSIAQSKDASRQTGAIFHAELQQHWQSEKDRQTQQLAALLDSFVLNIQQLTDETEAATNALHLLRNSLFLFPVLLFDERLTLGAMIGDLISPDHSENIGKIKNAVSTFIHNIRLRLASEGGRDGSVNDNDDEMSEHGGSASVARKPNDKTQISDHGELVLPVTTDRPQALTSEQLTNAQLTSEQLTNAQLTNAQLTNAQLTNAQLTSEQLTSEQLTNAQLTNAQLTNAQLTNAQLTNAQLTNHENEPVDVELQQARTWVERLNSKQILALIEDIETACRQSNNATQNAIANQQWTKFSIDPVEVDLQRHWEQVKQLNTKQILALIQDIETASQRMNSELAVETHFIDLLRRSLSLIPVLPADEQLIFCNALKESIALKDKNKQPAPLSAIHINIIKCLEKIKLRCLESDRKRARDHGQNSESIAVQYNSPDYTNEQQAAEKTLLKIAHSTAIEQQLKQLLALYPAGEKRNALLQTLAEKWLALEQALAESENKNIPVHDTMARLTHWQNHYRSQPTDEKESSTHDAIKRESSAKDTAVTIASIPTETATQAQNRKIDSPEKEQPKGERKLFDPLNLVMPEHFFYNPLNNTSLVLRGGKANTDIIKADDTKKRQSPFELNQHSLQHALNHLDDKIVQLTAAVVNENQVSYDAGLLILWPFLSTLFQRLDLLTTYYDSDKKVTEFVSTQAQDKAYALLKGLLGDEEEQDGYLGVANILVGYELDTVVDAPAELSSKEIEHLNELLSAVISRWEILRNMPIASFQNLFLRRECSISLSESGAHIAVEKQTLDILMQKMPWGLGMITLPWLAEDYLISVEWQY